MAKKVLEIVSRAARLDSLVSEAFAAGLSLPDTRKRAASEIGGTPSLYLGTVDPRYYRLKGLSTPLPPNSKYLAANGTPTATLARAVAKRRKDGVRWNVLSASVEAATGKAFSESAVRALAAKGGVDLEASYVGRGTRVGAPATYSDATASDSVPATDAA